MNPEFRHASFAVVRHAASRALWAALALGGSWAAQQAVATNLVAENFNQPTLGDPFVWVLSNGASSAPPCLTAADIDSGPQALAGGSIGGCNAAGSNPVDAAGSGVLRLTNLNGNQSGTLLYNTPLPTAGGLDLTFTQSQWGGSHADGISFFVKDGTNPSIAPGAAGGALGYSRIEGGAAGVPGGLFGVGLDAFGNYSAAVVGNCGGPPGTRTNSIAIRGADTSASRDGTAGFCWLGGTSANVGGVGLFGTTRASGSRVVRIVVDPDTVSVRNITVYLNGAQVLQVPVPAEFINARTFKFGFSAASGGQTDNHEISIANVATVKPLPVVTITAANGSSVSGTAPAATTFSSTGFVAPDTFSTQPTCRAYTDSTYGTPVTAATPAGSYVTHCTGAVAPGYVMNYADGVHTVTPPPPASVSLVSTANPASFGASVTFTATVTGVAPVSGTVAFQDNGVAIAGCASVAVAGGSAACTTAALPVGNRTITGLYSGNVANGAATGTVSQAINAALPSAVTGAATAVTTAGASLAGTAGAGGGATTLAFDYGTTTAYGSTLTPPQSPLAPTASGAAVSGVVGGLACGTTYHYRLRATNAAGTANGNDATFTTNACATLASISPDRGPLAGGTTVTLSGTGFGAGMTVSVDGVANACRPLALASATSATCVMPSHAAGTASVVMSAPGGSSNALTYTYDPVPVIDSLSPSRIPTAGGTALTITGTGFIAGATVSVNGVANACRPVSVASQTSLSCIMPAGPLGIVSIAVTTAGGTSAPRNLFYADVPEVTGVSPGRGPVAGGTAITVTGSSFSSLGSTLVVRIGGVVCTSRVKVSDSEITCVTPAGTAGAAPVTVETLGGTSAPGSFTYDNLPTVTAVKPSRGPVAGGTVVTISGTSFVAGSTSVSVGGQPCASVTHLSDAKLSCVVPAGAAGAQAVTVTTPGGTSAPGTYTYDDVPAIAAVTPSQGPVAGGTLITLDGTSFVAGRTTVTVGGVPCGAVTVIDAATATCLTPAQAAGVVEVRATTPGGTSGPGFFTFDNLPAVAAVSPDQGPTAGGTAITVTGTAFIAGSTTVSVGGAACAGVVVASDTSLTCSSPASSAGVKDVVVTTPGGASAPGFYTYDDLPVVKSVKPSAGPLAGGTTITIAGASFIPGGTTVLVGGAACTGVSVASTKSLTCVVPAGTAGVKDVTVTTAGGTSAPGSFSYDDVPTLAGVNPARGPLAGGTSITLDGTAFVAGATVTVGGAACAGVVVSNSTSLTCVTPAGAAGPAIVRVTTPGGTTNSLTFVFDPVPTLATVQPSQGALGGGIVATLTGTGFVTGSTSVTVGGAPCTAVQVTGTAQLTCTLPAGASGAANVVVTTPGGSSNAVSYTYDPIPAVTTVAPPRGPLAGGTTITLSGTGYVAGSTTVTVGGQACAGLNVASATSLTCVTPPGAAGAAGVIVTTPGGSSGAGAFNYDPVPTAVAASPSSGPLAGGTTITLTGTGFVAGATTVEVGGSPCGSVNVASATSLTCVTPAGSAGSAPVVVTTTGGTATAFGFAYLAAPAISLIEPPSGPLGGGTVITVRGAHFVAGATTVTIGGAACASVQVTGPSQLACVTPAGAAGLASVVVTTAGGTSFAAPFLYAAVTVGACGSANGITSAFKPATNLCSAGVASPVPIASPWSWTCAGSGGGATASCSAPNQNTATGTGAAFASLSGGTWVVDAARTAGFIPVTGHPKSPPVAVTGVNFPHGLLDFTLIGGTAGSAATITITYPQALPPGTQYWKYGPSPPGFNCTGAACASPHWYVMPASQAVIAGNTITLTIVDGGVGDDDLAANSVIVDQGGPGVPPAPVVAEPVPTLSEWALIVLASLMVLLAGSPRRRGARPGSSRP